MVDYKWVESVSVKQLSNKSLVLVSRFARVLKQVDGSVLSMQDPQLTRKMVAHVKNTNDPRLKAIFEELLLDFHGSLEGGRWREGSDGDGRQQAERGAVMTSPRKKKGTYRGIEF